MSFGMLVFFAIAGGVITFVSPCILPMIPIYLAYMSGSSLEEKNPSIQRTVLRTLAFIAGFTGVFVLFSVFFYVVFSSLSFVQQWIQRIAGAFIVLMGFHFLGLVKLPFLDAEVKLSLEGDKTKPWGSFLLGVSFAAGWSPCLGPVLSAILFSAATTQNLLLMIFLLLLFSAGLGIPFLLMGIFVSSAAKWVRSMKRFLPVVERISGILLVVLGLLLVLNTMGMISQWLYQVFPQLATLESILLK
ncbi:MAG: cytochrome c biogenesis CcdA family protein [Brevinematales bacterium]